MEELILNFKQQFYIFHKKLRKYCEFFYLNKISVYNLDLL